MTGPSAALRLRQRHYGAVSAAEVQALDAAALSLGIDVVKLMEAAGIQVARAAWRGLGRRPGVVHVVAGTGHNGGDGMVAARHLAAWGCAVSASVPASARPIDRLMEQQCAAATGAGVIVRLGTGVADTVSAADLTIDALLGTGLRDAPRPATAAVIEAMLGRVLSIDVPSGLDATTGAAMGATVVAATTVTLAACKLGFWQAGSRRYTGDVLVADIGMPAAAWQRCGLLPPTRVGGAALRRVPPP